MHMRKKILDTPLKLRTMLRHRLTQHPLLEHKRKLTNRNKHLNYPFTNIENQTSILDNSERKTQFAFITQKQEIGQKYLQKMQESADSEYEILFNIFAKTTAKIDLRLNNV